MALTSLKPPEIRADMLRGFVKSVHGIDGAWSRLDGERDQNFRIVDASGAAWVFKVCNPHEAAEIVHCQAGALEHIAQTDPALPVPRLRRARDGSAAPVLADSAGHPHLTLMLSYLPGEIAGERALSGSQLSAVGALVARLGRALRGFIDAAPASRRLVWDNRLAPQLLGSVDLLPAPQREPSRRMLTEFRDLTVPKLAMLRSQIIHGDIHPYNTLLAEDGAISGLIDFGDLVHAPLIQDLSNVIADYLMTGRDNSAIVEALVRGYCGVTRLEEDELDMLLDMVEMRLLMTPLVECIRAAEGVIAQGYLAQFGDRSFPLLAELQGSGRNALQNHGTGGTTAHVVREGQGNQRQAEQALAAHQRHARRAVQLPLQRHRDAPLDLLRRVAGKLADDRDLGVGDVRVGFDRRFDIRVQSERGDNERGKQRRHAAVNAGLDQ